MRTNQNSEQRKAAIHAVKVEVMNGYFNSQQKEFDQSFIDTLFAIAAEDQ